MEGVYEGGVRVGIWNYWYLSGKLQAESSYKKNNQLVGFMTYFNEENDFKSSEGEIRYSPKFMRADLPINSWRSFTWDKNGQLETEIIKEYDVEGNGIGLWSTYCHGVLTKVENFDKDNKGVIFNLSSEIIKILGCH